ncbi:MAG: 2-iminoacetate synthase [Betaproteobacteria bacterium ADurb.Bin341]|nr:MAG: 2-iminoacetate synthase [Betaproteobacteria bacterium ADurb.Bin341]
MPIEEGFDFAAKLSKAASMDIPALLHKEKLRPDEFLALLSPAALPHLEAMAAKAHALTVQYFGKTIQLYSPLYLSSFCTNECVYCGFRASHKERRQILSLEEVESNARALASTGIRHLLLLTGEAPKRTPLGYLVDCVKVVRHHFSSVGIEIHPLDEAQYAILKEAGVDSLTIYQETYDREIYRKVHLKGPKSDYDYRLETPARGAQAGFRSVNIGALYGLADPLFDAYCAGLHAKSLQDGFPATEISLSLPRLNPAQVSVPPEYRLSDARFVQFILAYRLFLPRLGITLSTRETAAFRDNLIPLGVTRMSAGSITRIGGYDGKEGGSSQFDISDERSVAEMDAAIRARGYEPVYKDWQPL